MTRKSATLPPAKGHTSGAKKLTSEEEGEFNRLRQALDLLRRKGAGRDGDVEALTHMDNLEKKMIAMLFPK